MLCKVIKYNLLVTNSVCQRVPWIIKALALRCSLELKLLIIVSLSSVFLGSSDIDAISALTQ